MNKESLKDSVLQADLETFVEDNCELLRLLANKTIVVSGATGLVGSQLLMALLCANRIMNLNIKLIGLVRNAEKVAKVFGDNLNRPELQFLYANLSDKLEVEGPVDYIIHGASITASKMFAEKPVEVIKTAIDGTYNMLELAREKAVTSFVYLSSMEMYGIPYAGSEYASEQDLGYIDALNTRSCYSEGKRMCENLCVCFAKEYGVDVKMARLAQTFGAGVDYSDSRVFAHFAKSYLDNKDIVLKTKGESYGNYCATMDVCSALLTIMLKGNNGEAYNIANETTNMQIKDMAKLVAEKLANNQIDVRFDLSEDASKLGFAPNVNLKLNTAKLKALGWKPRYSLLEMYEHLIASFKIQRGEE